MNSKIKLLLTLASLILVSAEYQSYANYKVYKVIPKSEKDVNILKGLENNGAYQFWTELIKVDQDVRIMVSPEKQSEFEGYLKVMEAENKVVIEDVQKQIDNQLRRPKINRFSNDYNWNYYQSLAEIFQWMEDIVAAHTDVAQIITIGNSLEGRQIKGVIIDFKKSKNKIIGMIEGGIHAREWISPATATYIINEFLTSDDPEIRALAENIVWHIFPVVNPDGYEYTFTNNRMWRKNRNPVSFTSCAQWGLSDDISNGIDLNRNFGFMWMSIGASQNPCAETYAGPTENSEMETIAIINYVQQLQTQGKLIYYFAFHSFAQMVLVPFSHLSGDNILQAPNYADMFEIAVRGMDRLRKRNNTEYVVGTSGDILYYVSGSSFDWAKGVAEVPIVYLFELRDDGEYGFLLPPEMIIDNNKEMMDGLLEMDRVTRQLGYYQPEPTSSGVIFTINIFIFFLTLTNVM